MTNNERLATIQADLLQPGVSPQVARKHLITLTAMWGDYSTAFTSADLAYKHRLRVCKGQADSATAATMEAEDSEEYRAMRFAKADEAFVLELIRTCKAAMRSVEEEMRLSR
jgi:hypothetical protein